MKNKKSNQCFLVVPTTIRTRTRFKAYCRDKQGISMAAGINALMESAAKNNFSIVSKTRTEVEVR